MEGNLCREINQRQELPKVAFEAWNFEAGRPYNWTQFDSSPVTWCSPSAIRLATRLTTCLETRQLTWLSS